MRPEFAPMILCNTEIQKAIDEGRLIIRPEPLPRRPTEGLECPYDAHSVNLTLADEISIPRLGTFVIDLTRKGSLADFLVQNSSRVRIDPGQGFTLEPNQFILARTREYVELPIQPGLDSSLAGRIEGKSSRARCAILVHFTAPTVHPGFKGTLTLEVINLGPNAFMLRPGMAIAQLIIEEVRGIPFPNASQFQGQTTPEGTL
jgi:dCTP deaminase